MLLVLWYLHFFLSLLEALAFLQPPTINGTVAFDDQGDQKLLRDSEVTITQTTFLIGMSCMQWHIFSAENYA